MGETPLSVNKVDSDGRVYLPKDVRDRYIGDQVAMYEPEPGRIIVQRVEIEE
jgi:bifunctional DNA-binding transcriptional regulator/antitoxin component of YhaV-PrlF toxin-antitoxin module